MKYDRSTSLNGARQNRGGNKPTEVRQCFRCWTWTISIWLREDEKNWQHSRSQRDILYLRSSGYLSRWVCLLVFFHTQLAVPTHSGSVFPNILVPLSVKVGGSQTPMHGDNVSFINSCLCNWKNCWEKMPLMPPTVSIDNVIDIWNQHLSTLGKSVAAPFQSANTARCRR